MVKDKMQTGSQLPFHGGFLAEQNVLPRNLPATYTTYRTLRKDPTVALGLAVASAPITAASWSVSAADGARDEVVDLIKTTLVRNRTKLVGLIADQLFSFGWIGLELAWVQNRKQLLIPTFKHLLPEITTILIDKFGNKIGLRQLSPGGQELNLLFSEHAAFHAGRAVEGSKWYGEPLLENIRTIQAHWDNSNDAASRYDRKAAGSLLKMNYSPGTTEVDGETTDNREIAESLANALQSSGTLLLPIRPARSDQSERDMQQWDVSFVSDQGNLQPGFTERLNYLDKLKIRGMLLPERSVLEGIHGTLAEAEAHANIAITIQELVGKAITSEVNDQIVDPMVELNYGPDEVGSVRLSQAPIIDKNMVYLRTLYTELIRASEDERQTISTDAVKDQLGVPKARESQ